MARTEAQLAQAREIHARSQQSLAALAGDPALMRALREGQHRFVDIALERVETDPLVSSVEKGYVLAKGARYRLRIHIGNRLADSLLMGETPPLDPLLPDPEGEKGHTLEVAVQGKDFQVLSPPVQELYLPLIGGSEPIYFTIRTPAVRGKATARICVYCKNHLLQSFLLGADVADSEERGSREALGVRLEFSRTARFTNLDDLGARALSINVNHDGATSTHELMVKGDNAAGELSLLPMTFDREMEEFRRILLEATFDPQNSSRARNYPEVPPGAIPSPDVSAIVRKLAKKGNELYRAVFRRAGHNAQLQKALQAIRERSDETLQVVRLDENFLFPWSMVYDYDVPEERAGMPPKPVCLGVTTDNAGAVVRCAHHHQSFDGYCANGFWGVRHYIEELLATGQEDALKTVQPLRGAGAIRIVADQNLPEATLLAKKLQKAIGDTEVVIGPEDDALLIDMLWKKPPERPAVLIVLGHLETQTIANEPDSPRIVLVPGSKWLTEQKMSQRFQQNLAWDQPRTLVLILACESAATKAETINDFVTAFNAAGSAAVIGTECIVFSRLVARFAEEVTLALWKGTALGKANTEFRRRLLAAGNPLAFVFRSIGDADLTIQR